MAKERYLTLLAALAWVAYFAILLTLPAQNDKLSLLRVAGSVMSGIAVLMTVLLAGERPRWPASWRIAMFALGIAAILVCFYYNFSQPWMRCFTSLGLVALALPVGYWIGDRMEKVTNLVPLAIAMSLADVYSVLMGPSREVGEEVANYQHALGNKIGQLAPQLGSHAIETAHSAVRAPFADFLLVHLPLAGYRSTVPVLGVGDFIILAFIFRAAWVHRLSARGVFLAALLSTLAALLASYRLDKALPALPFIALGVVGYLWLANPRIRRLDRQEALLSLGVAALFTVLIVGGLLQHWIK